MDPVIVRLINLQECDVRCDRLEQQLEWIPREIEQYRGKIEGEHQAMEADRKATRDLEVRQKYLETEVGSAEEQLLKYRNQQLIVKRNVEYRALQNEIDGVTARISELEDEEIALLIEIDEWKSEVVTNDERHRQNIEEFEGHIALRAKHREEFVSESAATAAALIETQENVGAVELKLYQYVKSRVKRPPYVVVIESHKCSGCHLRLPTDLEVAAKKQGERVRCNHCGRIVFAG